MISYSKIKFLLQIIIFLPTSLLLIVLTRIFYQFKEIKFLPVNFSRIANVYSLYWLKRVNSVIDVESKGIKLFFIENKFKHNKTWLNLWKKNVKFLSFSIIWKNFYYLNKFYLTIKNLRL